MYIVSKIVSARKELCEAYKILSILSGKKNAGRDYLSVSEMHCIDNLSRNTLISLSEKGRSDRMALSGDDI
jgi:hypothetical protein